MYIKVPYQHVNGTTEYATVESVQSALPDDLRDALVVDEATFNYPAVDFPGSTATLANLRRAEKALTDAGFEIS